MREDTQLQAIIPDYLASRTLGKNQFFASFAVIPCHHALMIAANFLVVLKILVL